jgi:hypothetical protein
MHPSDPKERFLSYVDIKTDVECWEWRGVKNSSGYGQFFMPGRSKPMAHRFSYELFVGEIPPGLVMDHLCRNKSCVNPRHLEPVSNRVNSVVRATGLMHERSLQTHCKRGHLLSGNNVKRMGKYKTRHCVTCKLARDKARIQAIREKSRTAHSA